MNINQNPLYAQEIKKVAEVIDIDELSNKSILITGATGLIGSSIVDILLWLNQNKKTGIKIFATSRKTGNVLKRFNGFSENDGLFALEYDATKQVCFNMTVDYIIHAASNASPNVYLEYPVDTMLSNIIGIHELLQYAVNNNVKKTVYVSSSEVYGMQTRTDAIREDEYGITNLLSVRSSYPVGKQASETLCKCYADQHNCDVSIVRPGHIYGPTTTIADQRASSVFARLAACGKNIVMKSNGSQIRSYCYCLDCASAILKVLTKGKAGEAYNISNKNSIITIRQMAEILAKHGHVSIINDFPSENEKAAFNPMNNSSLNSEKLENLGWQGLYDADTGLESTVRILRNIICD